MARETKRYKVLEYVRDNGRCPFRVWLETLPILVQARIQARIARFETGNVGDRKSLGGGVYEARLLFGPGYRLYFGVNRSVVIVLLCGGDKSSQRRDIGRAKKYWRDYLEGDDNGQT